MGRKSLATERTNQILDAFEVCICRYGFEGSSLAQIAQEAGVKRSIIRHYIGNRDAVVKALMERAIENYQQEMAEAIAHIPKDDFATAMLDHLFLPDGFERTGSQILLDALWAKQESDPYVKTLLQDLYTTLEELFTTGLCYAYPQAKPEQCRGVAYVLMCLLQSHGSFVELGLGEAKSQTVREAAGRFVAGLEA